MSVNDQIAADKDFTLTADVTVKANPASSGSGVYVGAFTDIEKAAAKLYAVGFRGANSGVYDMVYYRNKADNSYSGGKYNCHFLLLLLQNMLYQVYKH